MSLTEVSIVVQPYGENFHLSYYCTLGEKRVPPQMLLEERIVSVERKNSQIKEMKEALKPIEGIDPSRISVIDQTVEETQGLPGNYWESQKKVILKNPSDGYSSMQARILSDEKCPEFKVFISNATLLQELDCGAIEEEIPPLEKSPWAEEESALGQKLEKSLETRVGKMVQNLQEPMAQKNRALEVELEPPPLVRHSRF